MRKAVGFIGATLLILGVAVIANVAVADSECSPVTLSSEKAEMANNSIDFKNLRAEEREIFRQTLERRTVPLTYNQSQRFEGKTIEYQEDYYQMTVAHVECGELSPLFQAIGLSLSIIGLSMIIFPAVRWQK